MKTMSGNICALVTPVDEKGRPCFEVESIPVEKAATVYLGKDLGTLLRMPFADRLKLTEEMIGKYKKQTSIFVECGAASTAQTMTLAETCLRAGADGISVISPLFFGVTEVEQEHYYKNIAMALPDDYPIYLRYTAQLCNHWISREKLQGRMADSPNIAGLIDGSTDAVKMLSLARDREYQLVTDNESVFEVARLLGYDGYIS